MSEPVVKKRKAGRKPLPPKARKIKLTVFVEQSKVIALGGIEVCQRECYDFLDEKADLVQMNTP